MTADGPREDEAAPGSPAPGSPFGVAAADWERVRNAPERLLFLDYDGTLAPFHADRDRAVPLPATLERLRAIVAEARSTVTIVSGRPVEQVVALLGPLPVAIVGEHGWEVKDPDGPIRPQALDNDVVAALRAAHEVIVRRGHEDRIERKRTALVIHVRGLPRDEAAEILETCAALWRPWPGRVAVRLDATQGGLELRATGRDKGVAVAERISRARAGAFAVYVGDDRTDEDAFRVVRDRGLGVRVGSADVPTLASARLPGPEAMPGFLDQWRAATKPAAAGREDA